jgi:hypothetical protein
MGQSFPPVFRDSAFCNWLHAMGHSFAHSGLVAFPNYPYICRCRTLAETATKQLLVQPSLLSLRGWAARPVPSKQTSSRVGAVGYQKTFPVLLQRLKDHPKLLRLRTFFQRENIRRLGCQQMGSTIGFESSI